jgi:sortase (surface protein transpeptidase)
MTKTTVEILLDADYKIDQTYTMDDGRFKIILTKDGQFITLITDEPWHEEDHRCNIEFFNVFPQQH